MTNLDFSEIERIYAEWSKMDNSTKLTWLTRERIRLNGLANQLAQHISAKGIQRKYIFVNSLICFKLLMLKAGRFWAI
jgi:hypothetical protein